MLQDIQAAGLGLIRSRRWSAFAAVATLTVGVAACITAGAVAIAGLLRPLPFQDPGRLVAVERSLQTTQMVSGVRAQELESWRTGLASSMNLAGFSARERMTLALPTGTYSATGAVVSENFFEVLGVGPVAGRIENTPDAVFVTERFAKRHWPGTAPIGQTFTSGTRVLRVAAVLPPTMSALNDADLWMPAAHAPPLALLSPGDSRNFTTIARLHQGITIAAATADVERVSTSLQAPNQARTMWRIHVQDLRAWLIGDSRPVLVVFLGVTILVLVVAAANATMLLVNRAIARSREFAVRLALGAPRAHLLRSVAFEGVLIVSVAVGAGAWLAQMASTALAAQTGVPLPNVSTANLAAPGLVAAAGIWLLCLPISLVPALVLRSERIAALLKVSTSGSRQRSRIRGGLVIGQLAIAVVLLVGTGLMGRTLWQVSRADIGLDGSDRVLTMRIPTGHPGNDPVKFQRIDQLLSDVRRQPSVQAAGLGANLPPSVAGITFTIRYTSDDRDLTRSFDMVPVTDGYLEALGARVIDGRLFSSADMLSDQPIVVVSQSTIRHLDPAGESKLGVGRELNMGLPSRDGTRKRPMLLGIVDDIRYVGMDAGARGALYIPWRNAPMGQGFLIVRTAAEPRSLAPRIGELVRAVEPAWGQEVPRPLDAEVERSLAPRSARFALIGVFAASAIGLAIVGLTGALVRSVVERYRELAIRAAIGATPGRLLGTTLLQGVILATAGVALGLAGAFGLGRFASALLHEVSPYDPLTYGASAGVILLLAVAACYWPARRAAAADPVALLRSDG